MLPSLRMLLLLIGFMIVTGFVALITVVIYFTRAEDRQAVQSSQTVVQAAIEAEKRELASILDSYAWWDEAVAQVQGPADPSKIDINFGSYQTKSHNIVASFILDPADRTIIAFVNGKPASADAFSSLSGGLAALVRETRNSNIVEPVPATGFLTFQGRPVLVGADAITPELGSPLWPSTKPRYVLVFAQPVDGSFVNRIARRANVSGLQLTNRADQGLALLGLAGPDGAVAGWLGWIPGSPAGNMLLSAAPAAGITLMLMALLLIALLERVRRVGQVLRRQAALIDEVPDAILSTDGSGAITHWSAGATRMLGYKNSEIIGKQIDILFPEANRAAIAQQIAALRTGGRHFELEAPLQRRDGNIFPAHVSLTQVRDRAGSFAGMVGYALDITVQKDLQRRLEELATVDELTGAHNRRYLQIHGPIELQRARRFRRPLGALLLDIDHFKRVNDRYGHQFGDLVLATISDVCRRSLRPSDMFVRYGGEEFVIMMPETDLAQAKATAHRLADKIRGTVFSSEPPITGLTVSIGVCELDVADADIASLINRADSAMYRAKQLGRDRVECLPIHLS